MRIFLQKNRIFLKINKLKLLNYDEKQCNR